MVGERFGIRFTEVADPEESSKSLSQLFDI